MPATWWRRHGVSGWDGDIIETSRRVGSWLGVGSLAERVPGSSGDAKTLPPVAEAGLEKSLSGFSGYLLAASAPLNAASGWSPVSDMEREEPNDPARSRPP
jgi:hypothetical protein